MRSCLRPVIVVRSCCVRRLGVLLLVLVEVQIYGRGVVKYEVVLTIGGRSYIDVSSLTVDMHNVVYYLPISSRRPISQCSIRTLGSYNRLVVFSISFLSLICFARRLIVVISIVRLQIEGALLRRATTLIILSH